MGQDIEYIHISNQFEEVILVDPALKIIAEHLDSELDDIDAGANT